jgi:cell division protein FtsX
VTRPVSRAAPPDNPWRTFVIVAAITVMAVIVGMCALVVMSFATSPAFLAGFMR